MRLKLIRKRNITEPVQMMAGEEREFSDAEAKLLMDRHPGWFEKTTGTPKPVPVDDGLNPTGASHGKTRPAEDAGKPKPAPSAPSIPVGGLASGTHTKPVTPQKP